MDADNKTLSGKASIAKQSAFRRMARMALLIGASTLSVVTTATPGGATTVNVSIYFVRETVACSNGYESNGGQQMDSTRNCAELDYETVVSWKEDDLADPVQSNIPPQEVRLNDISTAIESYSIQQCPTSHPCEDPGERAVVVMVFQFDPKRFAGHSVWIERESPSGSRIGPYESPKGKVGDFGRWINHQRADVFLPSHNHQWILKTRHNDDAHMWTFGTTMQRLSDGTQN